MIRRWLRRRLDAIAMQVAREMDEAEDRVAIDLELGMAWRAVREVLPVRYALTLAESEATGHATASLFEPDAQGHAKLVHYERADTPTAALWAIHGWLR